MGILKNMYRTPLIPFVVMVLLVSLVVAEQDALGQVGDTTAARGERPDDVRSPVPLVDSGPSSAPDTDPDGSQITIGTPEHPNAIETTSTRPVSRDPVPPDGDNESAGTPPELPAPPDANIMLDSWFYYFSSLAQTIAAGSALLVALAVIRLQALASSLNEIQHQVGETFFEIGRHGDYSKGAFKDFLNDQWSAYFNKVESLANDNKELFRPNYAKSKALLDSLVAQGRKLETRSRKLHRALTLAFCGTVIFAGAAIIVLPAARWISPVILYVSWVVSGLLLVILFMTYLNLVWSSMKSK